MIIDPETASLRSIAWKKILGTPPFHADSRRAENRFIPVVFGSGSAQIVSRSGLLTNADQPLILPFRALVIQVTISTGW